MRFLDGLHAGFGLTAVELDDLVTRATGHRVSSSTRVVEGYDNEVHRVRLEDGAVVYLRVRPPGHPDAVTDVDGEIRAMAWARSAGVPVPDVIGRAGVDTAAGPRVGMVMAAAPGTVLTAVLAERPALRGAALASLGRLLATLHTVTLPGPWRPDGAGHWPDPDDLRSGFVRDRRAELPLLARAGLTREQLAATVAILDRFGEVVADRPSLCHNDLKLEHVHAEVDHDGRLVITALIDWGMWCGGTLLGELGTVGLELAHPDLLTIASHAGLDLDEPVVAERLDVAIVCQAVGHVAHHVSVDDLDGLVRPRRALTAALARLAR